MVAQNNAIRTNFVKSKMDKKDKKVNLRYVAIETKQTIT